MEKQGPYAFFVRPNSFSLLPHRLPRKIELPILLLLLLLINPLPNQLLIPLLQQPMQSPPINPQIRQPQRLLSPPPALRLLSRAVEIDRVVKGHGGEPLQFSRGIGTGAALRGEK